MNEAAQRGEELTNFVWRRLEQPFPWFTGELPAQQYGFLWMVVLVAVLMLALTYVVFMYIKDSRSVGIGVSLFLGFLRICVYIILAVVFMLPSIRTVVKTVSTSKVVGMYDISLSMQVSDELPTGQEGQSFTTRQEHVLDFLKKESEVGPADDPEKKKTATFFDALQVKNPVTLYRFGSKLDEEYLLLQRGTMLTRNLKENPPRDEQGTEIDVAAETPLPEAFWKEWLTLKQTDFAAVQDNQHQLYLDNLRKLNTRLVSERIMNNTNIADAMTMVLNKELNSRVQGVVVFTDGRPTQGTTAVFRELMARTKAAKVPIFVVGVGEDREKVKIEIASLRLPPQVQPEDKFRIVTEVIGEGLGGRELDQPAKADRPKRTMALEMTHVRTLKVKVRAASTLFASIDANKDGKITEQEFDLYFAESLSKLVPPEKVRESIRVLFKKFGPQADGTLGEKEFVAFFDLPEARAARFTPEEKELREAADKLLPQADLGPGAMVEVEREENLPIEVVERENPMDPKAPRARVLLTGEDKKLVLPLQTPAVFDKSALPRTEVEWQIDAAALVKAAGKPELDPDKKWGIGENSEDSSMRFVVRVPTDDREGTRADYHYSAPAPMKVIKKPLRVLLMAAGANRDYQFVQTLLVREMDERKTIDLVVYLQNPPGEDRPRTGVVQNVPKERLLKSFPDSFKAKKDFLDLQSYDAIIAYDPDWTQISSQQIKLLKSWAEQGGGLILVGGHINTVELVRPRERGDTKFEPILELLPVVLDDVRDFIKRSTDNPWPLDLSGATPEMEFLKLDEELEKDESKFKQDWNAFFFGEGKDTGKPERGFYNYYPVKSVKVSSQVVARFGDPEAKMPDKKQQQPFMVLSADILPRVIWIGSAETWRLREYKEVYHERFWTKLVRYAAGKSRGASSPSIQVLMNPVHNAMRYVDVEVKVDSPTGDPLGPDVKPEITLNVPPGVDAKEINGGKPISLLPRPGRQADGWFSGRFQVRSSGEYEMTVRVPRVAGLDSDLTESKKFLVKEANPELDNTRPDFDLMYRLASEADEVFLRMKESDAAVLRKALERPKLTANEGKDEDDKEGAAELPLDKPRLFFTLKNAHLIPMCMNTDEQVSESRGPHHDLWDEGWTIYQPAKKPEDTREPQPIKIPGVLCLVVFLLGLEWLIRKLLRLA